MLLDTLLTMFLTIGQCTQQGVLSLSNGIKSIDFKTTEKYIFEEALKYDDANSFVNSFEKDFIKHPQK